MTVLYCCVPEDLLAGVSDISELKRLAETNLLDDATRARMAHLGRFFERLRKSVPESCIIFRYKMFMLRAMKYSIDYGMTR